MQVPSATLERTEPAARDAGPAAAWVAGTAAGAAASYVVARAVGLGPALGPWAFWPLNGLLLAVFVRRPYREWIWLALAATVGHSAAVMLIRGDLAGGGTPLGAALDGVQAALGAYVLRRLCGGEGPLGRPRDLATFVVLAVTLIPLAVTPISAAALAGGLRLTADAAWRPLFAGNSLSMLLFAPLALPLPERRREEAQRFERAGEAAAFVLVMALLAVFIFRGGGRLIQYVAFPYAVFPLLAWAAVRCGPRWTSFGVVVLSAVACWYTARGFGPFAQQPAAVDERVLQLQAYLAFAALTGLLLSAQTEARRRSFEEISLQAAIRSAFFECSSAVLVLRDLAGRHVIANPTAEAAYGVPRERLLGRGSEALPDDDGATADAHDRRVLERGEPLVFEEVLKRPAGDRTLMVTRFPVRDHAGVARYVGMLGRDVTVERELDARLQRAQRVEVLGQLAAGLAHDLNNLLTVVVGNAGLLRLGAASAEDAESLDELLHAAQRASRLTGRLLAMGRRNAAPRAPLALDPALREMEPLLHALVRGGVDLALRPGAPGAAVLGDATEIEQIVLNLVSNARDAIGGAGRIEVETDEADAATAGAPDGATAARWVRLRVRDTGAGMDEATLARLFEPFFTTKQGSRGTGLGLYTTSVLVRQMGGAIRATSRPGEGSTFEVVLPRLEDGSSDKPSTGG